MSAPEAGYAFPWEMEAMKGEELPDGLAQYDQLAFLSLRAVYSDYFKNRIGREQGSAEKKKILGTWSREKRKAKAERDLAFFHARVIKDTEGAKTAVLKDPSPENAVRLCRVLDGLERYRPEGQIPNRL